MTDDNISISLHSAANHIMQRFNFKKVQAVMQYLKWSWGGNQKSPSVQELEATALALMRNCIAEFEAAGRPREGMNYATGGFVASIWWFDTPHLDLVFYVDHAASDGSH